MKKAAEIADLLIIRYSTILSADPENDPDRTEAERIWWLGRRHELKYILERLEIPIPEKGKANEENKTKETGQTTATDREGEDSQAK